MKKRLLIVGLLLLALIGVSRAVPIGTHTGYNPSVDSLIFNTYTFATLPTTTSFPFLASQGSAGTEITCRDCSTSWPPVQGPVVDPPIKCRWDLTNTEWNCQLPASMTISVLDAGAKCDELAASDGAMTSGSTTLTSASAPFVSNDCNTGGGCTGTSDKAICVSKVGVGAITLCGTIVNFTNTSTVTLSFSNTSGGDVTAARLNWGTDDTAAFATALVPFADTFVPQGSRCMVDHITFPTATSLHSVPTTQNSNPAVLKLFGGITPCTTGAGGVLQIPIQHVRITDLLLQSINSAQDCIVNISQAAGGVNLGVSGNFELSHLSFSYDANGPPASTNPVGIHMSGNAVVTGRITDNLFLIGTATGGFRQDIFDNATSTNNLILEHNTFNILTSSYPSVVNNRNYQTSFGQMGASVIRDNVYETGPNMLSISYPTVPAASPVTVSDNYFGDGVGCSPWANGVSKTVGNCVVPSYTTTADTHTGGTAGVLDNIASLSNLYVGMPLIIKGAGAAGADLRTVLTSITSASAGTISPVATTAVTGGNVFWQHYTGHAYFAVVAGTTAATTPVFPGSGTVNDGATLVWQEMQEGAGVLIKGGPVIFTGNLFGGTAVGIAGESLGTTANCSGIKVVANRFYGGSLIAEGVYGTWSDGCIGLSFDSNQGIAVGYPLGVSAAGSIHSQDITYISNFSEETTFPTGVLSLDSAPVNVTAFGSAGVVGTSASSWLSCDGTGCHYPSAVTVAGLTTSGGVLLNSGTVLQLGATPQPTPTTAVWDSMIVVKDSSGQILYVPVAKGPTAGPTP